MRVIIGDSCCLWRAFVSNRYIETCRVNAGFVDLAFAHMLMVPYLCGKPRVPQTYCTTASVFVRENAPFAVSPRLVWFVRVRVVEHRIKER